MEEHSIGQRLVAEAIGTGLLVFIGAGSVPAILLLEGGSKAPFSGADPIGFAQKSGNGRATDIAANFAGFIGYCPYLKKAFGMLETWG